MGGNSSKHEEAAAAPTTNVKKYPRPTEDATSDVKTLPRTTKDATNKSGTTETVYSRENSTVVPVRQRASRVHFGRTASGSRKGAESADDLAGLVQTIRLKSPKENALMVVAIDFGTTYSGYGYSFTADKLQFLTNYWDGTNLKTPTAVLLKPDKTLHSFGLDAKRHFEGLIKAKEHDKWYFFSRFKMTLFVREAPLDIDMKLEDIGGKEVLAIDVFAASLKFMVDHCKKNLNRRQEDIQITSDTDIHWILTVPAIWGDLSKQFMRKAAVKAGVRDDMLSLALEPEAASLFCKQDFTSIKINVGTKYLVLDLGGGTADITCHQVNGDCTLKELHKATGGDFGGTSVDEHFIASLIQIIGAKVFKQFKQEHMGEYWELIETFERKKKTFDGSDRIVFQFPAHLLEMHERSTGEELMETLQDSNLKDELEFKQGKIFISQRQTKRMFDETVDKIIQAAQDVIDKIDGIEHVVLVGGFSESPYLQKVMREKFHNLIQIPKEPSGAVLKGAVIFGHERKAISSRVCKFTYGIARMMKFKPDQHPERKRVTMGDRVFCDDLFSKHIEIGQAVSLDTTDHAKVEKYYPTVGDMRQAVLEVYASDKKNPTFVDEKGCTFVGLIKVDIDPKGNIWAELKVRLIFGGTELIVEVNDVTNNKITQGAVEFFG